MGLGTGLKTFALSSGIISAGIPLESPCSTRSKIGWGRASNPVFVLPRLVTRIVSLRALFRATLISSLHLGRPSGLPDWPGLNCVSRRGFLGQGVSEGSDMVPSYLKCRLNLSYIRLLNGSLLGNLLKRLPGGKRGGLAGQFLPAPDSDIDV